MTWSSNVTSTLRCPEACAAYRSKLSPSGILWFLLDCLQCFLVLRCHYGRVLESGICGYLAMLSFWRRLWLVLEHGRRDGHLKLISKMRASGQVQEQQCREEEEVLEQALWEEVTQARLLLRVHQLEALLKRKRRRVRLLHSKVKESL